MSALIDRTFIDQTTIIDTDWLNGINDEVVAINGVLGSTHTAAAFRSSLAAAAIGANSDITSLNTCTSVGATAGTSVKGTNTNDNAAAGYVGEFITGNLSVAAATSLVDSTPKTIISIALTAGDWDVYGTVIILPTGVAPTYYGGAVSSVTNTLTPEQTSNFAGSVTSGAGQQFTVPYARVSIAAPATYYLVAQANFTSGSCKAAGTISARRVR